jgi:GTPase SAR1 family protein
MEKFNSLNLSYFRGRSFVLFVFDLAAKESFGDLEPFYNKFRSVNPDAGVFRVGNKLDLEEAIDEDERISEEETTTWCKNHNCEYYRVSAWTNDGVPDLQEAIIQVATQQPSAVVAPSGLKLAPGDGGQNESSCSCTI